MSEILTDESLMPWGKWKGTKMANVPADYLLWLHKEGKYNASVKAYILENLELLKKEANKVPVTPGFNLFK